MVSYQHPCAFREEFLETETSEPGFQHDTLWLVVCPQEVAMGHGDTDDNLQWTPVSHCFASGFLPIITYPRNRRV